MARYVVLENATESLYLENKSLQKRATAEQLPIRKRDLVDICLDISKCDAALLCACFNQRPYEYDYRNM